MRAGLRCLLLLCVPGWLAAAGHVEQAAPGPWGNLRYSEAFLEPPDEILRLAPAPAEQTTWRFYGMTPEQIGNAFRQAGLTAAQFQSLMDTSSWIQTGTETRIFPGREVLESLSERSRVTIYALLGTWEENTFHRWPVVIEDGDARTWFDGANLREPMLQAIEKLSYPTRHALLFADVPYLLKLVETAEEEKSLRRALYRRRTLLVTLRPGTEEKLPELANYWSAENRARDCLPVLESATRQHPGEDLDLVHLFPPTPRQHLHCYPGLGDGFLGRFPDGFWTALNFFTFTPEAMTAQSPGLDAYVKARHYRVDPPYRFGDVLLVVRERDRQAIHACVYVADDLVYTKNGPDLLSPWVIMKLNPMLAYHQPGEPIFLSGWRRNP